MRFLFVLRLIGSLLFFVHAGCSGIDPATTDPMLPEKFGIKTSDHPENEVQAALVQIMRVASSKNIEAFRQLIYPQDLFQFDADEGEARGSYQSLMAEIASHKVKDYRIERSGSEAVLIPDRMSFQGQKPTSGRRLSLIQEGSAWMIRRSTDFVAIERQSADLKTEPSSKTRPSKALRSKTPKPSGR